jgi:hypothetical protein
MVVLGKSESIFSTLFKATHWDPVSTFHSEAVSAKYIYIPELVRTKHLDSDRT